MKILMIAPQPFFTPRGTPFSVLYRLRALSALGHEVDLATYHLGRSPEMPGLTIHRIPAVPGVKRVKIGPSPIKIVLDALLLALASRLALENKYQVIHTHEEAGLMGAALSRLLGIPHLYDMHSSLPQQFGNFDAFNLKPVVAAFEAVESLTLAGADGVITICPELAQHVEARGYPRPHQLIENTYTDEPDAEAVKARARELESIHDLAERKVVLYTGTFEAYQGLDLLVGAAGQVAAAAPAARFVVVGGHPDQVATLQQRIDDARLAEAFLLTGQVAPEEIPAWLERADLLVSPRISGTNTPLKIYQYLKSGVPLVATDISSHTQILDSSLCLLVPPTAQGLAEGLEQMLARPDLARSLGEAGRARARAEYSNAAYVERVRHILAAVAESGAATARAGA